MRLFTLLLLLSPIVGFTQSFEGTIIYSNTYKSKSPQLKDEQLNSMMGTKQEYFIKGGDYKSIFNGSFIKMQLFKGAENRSYTLLAKSDTLYWEDCGKNKDLAVGYKIEKAEETVLGVSCDVLIVSTPKSKTHYYYNKKYGINPALFTKHQYGNWYFIISKTKALPLKTIYEDEQFILTSTAVKIIPMHLDDSTFSILDKNKVAPSMW